MRTLRATFGVTRYYTVDFEEDDPTWDHVYEGWEQTNGWTPENDSEFHLSPDYTVTCDELVELED